MNRRRQDPETKPRPDDTIDEDIRRRRRFSLGEAIGREGGSGLLQGASPVAHQRQLESAIEELLDDRLDDPDGALRNVLFRAASSDLELAEERQDVATRVLDRLVRSTLASQLRLEELVRRADAEWGHAFDERPRFDRHGQPTADDDPYTLASVRERLEALLDRLGD